MADGIKRLFRTFLTDTSSEDVEGIGTLRFEGNNVYKWVTYSAEAGAVAAVVGNACYYTETDSRSRRVGGHS